MGLFFIRYYFNEPYDVICGGIDNQKNKGIK